MSRNDDAANMSRVTNNLQAGPTLTVQQSGQGYFNHAACEKWLNECDRVGVYLDPDETKIGFAPDEEHRDTYSLTGSDGSGATVSIQKALTILGVDLDELGDHAYVPLEKSGDLLIADLSEVADDG